MSSWIHPVPLFDYDINEAQIYTDRAKHQVDNEQQQINNQQAEINREQHNVDVLEHAAQALWERYQSALDPVQKQQIYQAFQNAHADYWTAKDAQQARQNHLAKLQQEYDTYNKGYNQWQQETQRRTARKSAYFNTYKHPRTAYKRTWKQYNY